MLPFQNMQFLSRFKRSKSRLKKRSANPKIFLIRQIVFGVLLLALLAGIGTGVWYGTRVEALTIQSIEIIGGETVDIEKVRVLAETELVGEYYHLIPKRFAFTYPRQKIHEAILAIDRVKNVLVDRTSGTDLVIVFEEHSPFALWCEHIDSKECLFLDRQAFAFGLAPKLQGGAFLRFSETGVVPQKNQVAFSAEFIQSTTAFIERVYATLGLNIIHVEKTSDEELVYYLAGGGTLKVSGRLSLEDTLENLTTILTSEAFDHLEPGNFQYIDLRYGNKVFVNEELESEVSTSTASTSTES